MPGNSPAAASPSFWRDRPVFVTGASGLLGSWLVRQLLAAGADVVALVRDWVPRSELVTGGLLDRVRVVRADVRDQEAMERALGEYEIATVFHLAAQTTVGVANRNPISTLDTNIRGTWAVLEACRRTPTVQQVVTASSDKAYGEQDNLPYREDQPVLGRHPYDVSKSCADLLSQMYAKTYRLPVCVTRCGNFYGGGISTGTASCRGRSDPCCATSARSSGRTGSSRATISTWKTARAPTSSSPSVSRPSRSWPETSSIFPTSAA